MGPQQCVSEVYPDLCPEQAALYEACIWYYQGDKYLRLSNGIANVGLWELFFEPSGPVNPVSGKRPSRQRVGCVKPWGDTLVKYYPADSFVYHPAPCHDHLHLGKVAEYSIRVYGGTASPPGTPLAFGDKVGFCLLDGVQYEGCCCGLPEGEGPLAPYFTQGTCSYDIDEPYFFMGVSIGWRDKYSYSLADQWIELPSTLSPGPYWLESVVDPTKFIKQKTRANDTVRIPVFIAYKDLYEPNETHGAVDAMPVGGSYSSNLSACQTTIDNLSIHREYDGAEPCLGAASGDVDYFKINLSDDGSESHFVRIRFGDSSATLFKDGNLDLELRDANNEFVDRSDSNDDDETIMLDGRGAGIYYVKVYGRAGDPTPNIPNSNHYYRLELSLPPPEPVCGDVNGDGLVDPLDVQILTNHVFGGGNLPCPQQANVHSDDCALNSSDVITLSNHVYPPYDPLPPNACTCP